jgi:hypothetical protein
LGEAIGPFYGGLFTSYKSFEHTCGYTSLINIGFFVLFFYTQKQNILSTLEQRLISKPIKNPGDVVSFKKQKDFDEERYNKSKNITSKKSSKRSSLSRRLL